MRALAVIVFGSCASFVGGCLDTNMDYTTPDRMQRGLVIILPGIEGESWMNHGIRDGLDNAGINRALPIYHWGRPIPIAGPLINQMDFIGNRLAGGRVAGMVVQYQDSHPGMPVYIIGHSGGGGVAVFAAEALPPGRQVDGLILLSASINADYDLTKALAHSKHGLVCFYNPSDKALLLIGTMLAGNVDGTRGPSAGLNGFGRSYPRLYQVQLTEATAGDGDPHAAATRASYVSRYVAPWVTSADWPAH